jgi:hypothetical protein
LLEGTAVIEHEVTAPTTVTVALYSSSISSCISYRKVTVFAPIFEQLNEVLDADNVTGPHSSLLPLFIQQRLWLQNHLLN